MQHEGPVTPRELYEAIDRFETKVTKHLDRIERSIEADRAEHSEIRRVADHAVALAERGTLEQNVALGVAKTSREKWTARAAIAGPLIAIAAIVVAALNR